MSDVLTAGNIIREAKCMGVLLTPEQAASLEKYARLLLRWNETHNLTSIQNEEDVLKLHILDSLTLVRAVDFEDCSRVLDVGSGGGLPAIPLAITKPSVFVTMVDSVKKKVMFLRQVIIETKIKNAQAIHGRVENIAIEPVDYVTSRAFASLGLTVELTRNHLKNEGCWLSMKGKLPVDEIASLPKDVSVDEILELSHLNESLERHLVRMSIKKG